jgi:hypothetical protein
VLDGGVGNHIHLFLPEMDDGLLVEIEVTVDVPINYLLSPS